MDIQVYFHKPSGFKNTKWIHINPYLRLLCRIKLLAYQLEEDESEAGCECYQTADTLDEGDTERGFLCYMPVLCSRTNVCMQSQAFGLNRGVFTNQNKKAIKT